MQRIIQISGVVQGVGFRPQIWRLVHEIGLTGWVRNNHTGVEILLQGDIEHLEIFTHRLLTELPPRSQLQRITWRDKLTTQLITNFTILPTSDTGTVASMIGIDSAVCTHCLVEMFDSSNRRWRYPFINCTHCGPRYTITRELPYDRAQTSMAAFPLCSDCCTEYHNPTKRRFHAESTGCPVCGPRLWIEPLKNIQSALNDPITEILRCLNDGQIVAIKGLGGFHLACDARNRSAVQQLRQRKQRDAKPFALMVANPASISQYVALTETEVAILESPAHPIVVLRKTPLAEHQFPDIAPGLAWLGVMLPYTPLHWLIFHEAAQRPNGIEWCSKSQSLILVMTSANASGEPLIIDNQVALDRLMGIADVMLTHNREITVPCDDSVVRSATPQFIRRARGYAPLAIHLPRAGLSVLALGALFKNTICLTSGKDAFISQHLGDLDNPTSCEQAATITQHLLDLIAVTPKIIAHDAHSDFFSTHQAHRLAAKWQIPTLAVQHHHAHIAAVMAEHGICEPTLGLAMDGVGLGSDHTAWGGELLLVNQANFSRVGHLNPLPLSGFERAAKEPWRMAAAVLHNLGRGAEIAQRFKSQSAARHLNNMLISGYQCPPTTSLGRWFDAAAGLLGICTINAYDGQAAMLLESLAEQIAEVAPFYEGYYLSDNSLNFMPLMARLADETNAAFGASLFHTTIAHALADWAINAAHCYKINTVILSGGCFLNQVLTKKLMQLLKARHIITFTANQVPPNDGGISLGQAWVAMQQLNL